MLDNGDAAFSHSRAGKGIGLHCVLQSERVMRNLCPPDLDLFEAGEGVA